MPDETLTHAPASEECPTLHFPIACGQCAEVAGYPKQATTLRGGGVLLTIVCRDCGHQWECTIPPTETLFVPKADRREG